MILNTRVKMVARTFLAAASSSILSTALHVWIAPLLAPRLVLISRPAGSFPWWAPVTVKLIESILLSTSKLSNAWDAALIGTIGRAPFLDLLFSSYSIPWYTVLSLYIIQIAILAVPQYFLATSVPPHTPYDDIKLSSYTSLLSATFLSLPLYYFSVKFLPMTLVTYFDAAKSVHPMPLPIFIGLNLPTGYAIQALLTRYGVKGAVTALANVLVTGSGLMYYDIGGAELKGVQIIDTMWIISVAVSVAATYLFVLRK